MSTLLSDIPTTIIKKKGLKRLSMQITPEGLVIKSPYRINQKTILNWVQQNTTWIEQKWSSVRKSIAYQTGDHLEWLGHNRRLKISTGANHVEIDNSTIHLTTPNPSTSTLQALWHTHCRNTAKAIIPNRAQELADDLGLYPKHCQVKHYKSRWGSCDKNGNVSFNWRLMAASHDTIDYVIIHELCHLQHFNHSPEFWQLVATHCAAYKEHIKWLKNHVFYY